FAIFPDVARDAEDVGGRGRDKIMAAMGTALFASNSGRLARDRAVEIYLRFLGGIAGARCIFFVGKDFDQLAGQMNQRLPLVRAKAAPAVMVLRISIGGPAAMFRASARLAVHLFNHLSQILGCVDVRFQRARRDFLFKPDGAGFQVGAEALASRGRSTGHEAKDGRNCRRLLSCGSLWVSSL
ncbi:MAG: hypothetical protein HOM52_00855, partial [Rhodospirillaceae bacterium]|nr:hypothetical protein [Rhodospirillaceae bacterium]